MTYPHTEYKMPYDNHFEYEGELIRLDETRTFVSGFQKREFVLLIPGKYPKELKFEAVKERCDELNDFNVGDKLLVKFDIRGNEHNGRHYVNLVAWSISRTGAATEADLNPNTSSAAVPDEAQDDIPF